MTRLNSENTPKVYIHDQEMAGGGVHGTSISQIQLRDVQLEEEGK